MAKKYYKLKINKLLLIENIVTIHYFEFPKVFHSKGERHDFWEMVYADKKDIIVTAGDKDFPLKEGEAVFHKPDEFHALKTTGKDAPNVFIVSFVCKSQAAHFFDNKIIKLEKPLIRFIYSIIEESKKTFDLPYSDPELKKMELLKNPLLGGEQMIKNYLEMLLISIMRQETKKANSDVIFLQREEFEGHISRSIISVMNDRITDKFSVADFCETLHYNKSYIHKQFKKETGETLMSYFTKLKINHAKKLLREGNMNVAEVADHLSFDTPNYFSKTFKKVTGLTPLQYKKMYSETSGL